MVKTVSGIVSRIVDRASNEALAALQFVPKCCLNMAHAFSGTPDEHTAQALTVAPGTLGKALSGKGLALNSQSCEVSFAGF